MLGIFFYEPAYPFCLFCLANLVGVVTIERTITKSRLYLVYLAFYILMITEYLFVWSSHIDWWVISIYLFCLLILIIWKKKLICFSNYFLFQVYVYYIFISHFYFILPFRAHITVLLSMISFSRAYFPLLFFIYISFDF